MTDEFRHRTRVQVRFRDLDAFGHVNNSVTSTYVEEARVTFCREILGMEPASRMPLILAHQCLDYHQPILYPAAVLVDSRVDWIGRSSLAMTHRLTSEADGGDLASASSVLVAYDYAAGRSMPVPEAWRATLVTHEGRALTRPVPM